MSTVNVRIPKDVVDERHVLTETGVRSGERDTCPLRIRLQADRGCVKVLRVFARDCRMQENYSI